GGRRRGILRRAVLALRHPAEIADETDERPTILTGIPFGRALFPPASTAHHTVFCTRLLAQLSSPAPFGLGLVRNVIQLDLIDERRPRYPQLFRRPRPIPTVISQRALDMLMLERFERHRRMAPITEARSGAELTGQMLDVDRHLALGHHHGSL